MILAERARAKVNLFLHVGPPGADGRHPLCSLVVFANVADRVEAEPAPCFALTADGPFAHDIGPSQDNLISRALVLAGARPLRVHLEKNLPAASGLGGGTADAGAALRLASRLDPALPRGQIEAAARTLGADGLMCLKSAPCLAEGEGEQLSSAPLMPAMPAVLINPGVPSPTGAVYRAYDQGTGPFSADRPGMPKAFETVRSLAQFLSAQRNDLQAPAARLAAEIDVTLQAVARQKGVLLTRMSGSGATVFGLFETDDEAILAARTLADLHPGWWVRACRLNGEAGSVGKGGG